MNDDELAELETLPETFRAERLRRHKTLRQVEAATGVNYSVMNHFENRTHDIGLGKAIKLIKWLQSNDVADEARRTEQPWRVV